MNFSEEEFEEFRAEAFELLDTVEKSLMAIDSGSPFKVAFDSSFRSFHNLKGASGIVEMLELQEHTHELENVLMQFETADNIPKSYVNLFLRGIDAARSLLCNETIDFKVSVELEKILHEEASQNSQGGSATVDVNQVKASVSAPLPSFRNTGGPTVQAVLPPEMQGAVQEFFVEADEILERVFKNIHVLEIQINERLQDPEKANRMSFKKRPEFEELFRDIHSLKGSAYLFSFVQLGEIAHGVEAQLEFLRIHEVVPSTRLINCIYNAAKILETELGNSRSGNSKPETKKAGQLAIDDLASSLMACLVSGDSAKADPPKVDTQRINAEAAVVKLPKEMSHKEISQTDGRVAQLGIQNRKKELEEKTMGSNESGNSNSNTEHANFAGVGSANTASAASGNSAGFGANGGAGGNSGNGGSSANSGDSGKDRDQEGHGSIRVPVSLLDNLMTLMGEMVLVRNQVLQFSSNSEDLEFQNLSKRLNVVTSEIQGELMKTRMQPIGNVLTKFNRVVRDISQELGKKINLTILGSETELDKSLLEAIKDPLTHIVRNACDHGLELPQTRIANGKPEMGFLIVRSFHEGGQVVIEVCDDGKGLHKDVLLRKGIEKGLITDSQAKQMSDKEIYHLIFAPGFSTAAKVTNLSGRGVGMDVVRTNIEKIGGTVDLISSEGKGTTIRMKIPLTLAIVPALIVHSGNGIFAIPQVKLVELVRVDQASADNKIEFIQGTPVFRLRGNILPLVDLNKVLRLEKTQHSNSSIMNIAVLNAEHCSFGLIVDEVQDTADIVVKPLNRLLKSLQVYSGATILGDGSVALILDVLGLSKIAQLGKDESSTKAEADATLSNNRQKNSDEQDYLLVKVNSPTKHAIVLGYVHRLEEFKKSAIEFSGSNRVIRYRNHVLPIISANKILNYKANFMADGDAEQETQRAMTNDKIPVVVVERSGRFFGIEVDEILDTLTSGADIEAALVNRPGLFGNLNTQDELIVIIDPFELINEAYPEFKTTQKYSAHRTGVGKQPAGGVVAIKGGREEEDVEISSSHIDRAIRILVVDDTMFFRKTVTKILEKAGHHVTVANDGQDALDLLYKSNEEFDLIVSDIEMPRLNGFEFARAVRGNDRYKNVPMLALSSKADRDFVKEGLGAGFDAYLEKLKPNVLLQTVSDLYKNKERAA